MSSRKHIPRWALMLLALSLTGAIATKLLWVEKRYLFRIHSKYGCTIDTAVEAGMSAGHGQFTLPCGQSTTIEDMSDDIRFTCVCE